MSNHLNLAQLLSLRDRDCSEPGQAQKEHHLAECPICQLELERLHQRTARLRALPPLSPETNLFPAVQRRLLASRTERRWRRRVSLTVLTAAALALWAIGRNLIRPEVLKAEQEIAEVQHSSQILEQRLAEWDPDQRLLDGGTVIFLIDLKDRIAQVDQALNQIVADPQPFRLSLRPVFHPGADRMAELALWRERERLMDALLKAHVSRSARIAF